MYILKPLVTVEDEQIVYIEPTNHNKLSQSCPYSSPDAYLRFLVNMNLFRYRKFAVNNLNLKIDIYYPKACQDSVPFIYAETIEDATKWKEWVESCAVLKQLV